MRASSLYCWDGPTNLLHIILFSNFGSIIPILRRLFINLNIPQGEVGSVLKAETDRIIRSTDTVVPT